MDKDHPTVQPQEELHGEEEGPVTEELGDPVPRLSRGTKKGRSGAAAPNQRRKPYIRPAGYPVKAYHVADAICLTGEVSYTLRGAAPVGRCLDKHARDTAFSAVGKNGLQCHET